MSRAGTPAETQELPEPDAELVCEISCMCGWSETVEESDDYQTHAGTAGELGARHDCPFERGERQVPKGQKSMRFNWVFW